MLPEDVLDSRDDIFCLRLCELDGLGRRFKDGTVWLKFGDGRELGGIRRLGFLSGWNGEAGAMTVAVEGPATSRADERACATSAWACSRLTLGTAEMSNAEACFELSWTYVISCSSRVASEN